MLLGKSWKLPDVNRRVNTLMMAFTVWVAINSVLLKSVTYANGLIRFLSLNDFMSDLNTGPFISFKKDFEETKKKTTLWSQYWRNIRYLNSNFYEFYLQFTNLQRVYGLYTNESSLYKIYICYCLNLWKLKSSRLCKNVKLIWNDNSLKKD